MTKTRYGEAKTAYKCQLHDWEEQILIFCAKEGHLLLEGREKVVLNRLK